MRIAAGCAVASGIRIGTPIVSTRGMGQKEMVQIVDWMDHVLQHPHDKRVHRQVAKDVKTLCAGFPIFHTYKSTSV